MIALLVALGAYAFVLLSNNERQIDNLNTRITEPTVNILEFDNRCANLTRGFVPPHLNGSE